MGPSDRSGVIVGVKTRREIDLTVAELLELGIGVLGQYVAEYGAELAEPDNEPWANRRAAGAVDRLNGTNVVLRGAPGVDRVDASQAWLESRLDTLYAVVRAGTVPPAHEARGHFDGRRWHSRGGRRRRFARGVRGAALERKQESDRQQPLPCGSWRSS